MYTHTRQCNIMVKVKGNIKVRESNDITIYLCWH